MDKDFIRKQNALQQLFFHINDPDALSDDDWMENVRRLEWLSHEGLLGIKASQ